MKIFGYIAVLVSLYFLFVNKLILGILIFSLGLFLSCGLRFNTTCIGVVLMVFPGCYIFHNGFSLVVSTIFFTGFVIVCIANGKALENYDHEKYWGNEDD